MTTFRARTNPMCISGVLLLLFVAGLALAQTEKREAIIHNLPATPTLAPTTVPSDGDVNPYGVAFIPHNFAAGGAVHPGDIIVSNFNNNTNTQGTGTTIVRITPDGQTSLFFQGQPGLGLTTALGVVRRGFALVGSLPTTDGSCNTIGQTSLLIIDRNGNLVATLSDPTLLDGPWDLTVHDQGERAQVFVSNVLSGTVTRINLRIPQHGDPIVESMTQIASRYGTACNTAAVVVGPTGLAYDAAKDILYVASTSDNEIFAVPHARKTQSDQGTGTLIYQDNVHLHGPLALALAPNGDLITANGDAVNTDTNQPSELVEFTVSGQFVGQFSIDPGIGAAFGLAVAVSGDRVRFAAVDDATNVLDIWDLDGD
jgi:hypothetical protein